MRAKHILVRDSFVDVAAGASLSVPTGDRDDLQGTGDTLIAAALYGSQTYAERLEPHLNVSFVLDADKFDRSQVRYSLGADVRLLDWLTLNTDFLGRSDIAQPDSIDRPVFLQIERADVFQFSTGVKIAPSSRTVLFFNALVPLNDDGVRPSQAFAGGVEVVF